MSKIFPRISSLVAFILTVIAGILPAAIIWDYLLTNIGKNSAAGLLVISAGMLIVGVIKGIINIVRGKIWHTAAWASFAVFAFALMDQAQRAFFGIVK